jgi:hypothetical protein
MGRGQRPDHPDTARLKSARSGCAGGHFNGNSQRGTVDKTGLEGAATSGHKQSLRAFGDNPITDLQAE